MTVTVFTPPRGAKSATVRARTTARGTGRYARAGEVAQDNKEISFRITSTLPDVSVDVSLPNVTSIDEDEHQRYDATVTGLWDQVELIHEVVAGDACLVEVWTEAPNLELTNESMLDENGCLVVYVTPSGGLYDPEIEMDPDGTEYQIIDWVHEVVSGDACLVPYFEKKDTEAPDVAFTDRVGNPLAAPDIDEDGCAVVIVTPTDGFYDPPEIIGEGDCELHRIDWVHEVVAGDACLVEYFVKTELELPTTLTLTNVNNIDEDGCAVYVVTPSNDGWYDPPEEPQIGDQSFHRIEWVHEIVAGDACVVPYFQKQEVTQPTLSASSPTAVAGDDIAIVDITSRGGTYDADIVTDMDGNEITHKVDYVHEIISGDACLIPFIRKPAVAPKLTFDHAMKYIKNGEQANFVNFGDSFELPVILEDGRYDAASFEWEFEPDPCDFNGTFTPNGQSARYDSAGVKIGTKVTLKLNTKFEGKGVLADNLTFVEGVHGFEFFVELPEAIAPFTEMTNVGSVGEDHTIPINVNPRNGLYDDVEYVHEIIAGNACLIQESGA